MPKKIVICFDGTGNRAYFDGSGKEESSFLVLSGVAAQDATWDAFDQPWQDILEANKPPASYLHMKELCALRGGFCSTLGWDETSASALATAWLMYARTLDKSRFRVFTCSIDMGAYRAVLAEGKPLPDCHDLCVAFTCQQVLKWYEKNFNENFPQQLKYFFDRGSLSKGGLSSKRGADERVRNGFRAIGT